MPIKVKVNNDWVEVTARPSDDLPLVSEDNTGSAGISPTFSRSDHVHPLQEMPLPSNENPTDLGVSNPGNSSDYARADHMHNCPVIPNPSDENPNPNGEATAGISNDYSRADHVHPLQEIPEMPIPSSTLPKINGIASQGEDTNFARGDHVHPEQINISGNASTSDNAIKWNGSNKTISIDPPAGGENGDIWFQIIESN